jgi:vacuolar-type H+-ATPase subunit E/Vma4
MDLGFTRILSDETIDAIIIGVSVFLILFTLFLVRPVLRSQRILHKWSNLFENNAIRTGIILTIKNKSKEEILYALPEVIEQIASPLEDYLSKSDKKEFYNVNIDDITTFDILIDKSTIKSTESDSLKNAIQEYGSILIKIVDKIDKGITEDFLKSLQKFKKRSEIGLAIIIGNSISQESYILVNKIKDSTIRDNLILIEKPVNNEDHDLKSLNNILS